MAVKSEEILVYSLIGLIINILSAYLFSLNRINITQMIFILGGSLIFIIILGVQYRTNEIIDELDNQKTQIKKLDEKLKIYKQLIDVKADIKFLKENYDKKK